MAVKCCNGCKPPKRTGDCHVTCPDYIIDKAFDAVEKDEIDKIKQVKYGIAETTMRSLKKTLRSRGVKFEDRR